MTRLRTPDLAAGALGAGLLVSLFLPWWTAGGVSASGWEVLSFIDLWLALLGLMGVGLVVVTATRAAPALPVALDVLTTWVGFVALPLMAYRVLNVPGPAGVERAWGLFVGLVCAYGVTAAAFRAMRLEAAPGLRANPAPQRMPAPPAGS